MIDVAAPPRTGWLDEPACQSCHSGTAVHNNGAIRYLSVFKYYGNAIEDGIDPLAFIGVTLAACVLAAIGAWLFDQRDLAG